MKHTDSCEPIPGLYTGRICHRTRYDQTDRHHRRCHTPIKDITRPCISGSTKVWNKVWIGPFAIGNINPIKSMDVSMIQNIFSGAMAIPQNCQAESTNSDKRSGYLAFKTTPYPKRDTACDHAHTEERIQGSKFECALTEVFCH